MGDSIECVLSRLDGALLDESAVVRTAPGAGGAAGETVAYNPATLEEEGAQKRRLRYLADRLRGGEVPLYRYLLVGGSWVLSVPNTGTCEGPGDAALDREAGVPSGDDAGVRDAGAEDAATSDAGADAGP